MAIIDDLTPRQCLVIAEILSHPTGLLRSEIAQRIGKDEKTVERILKSLPKWVVRKKRDLTLNGAPYRYRARLRRASHSAFAKKMEAIHKDTVPATVPSDQVKSSKSRQ